jgi:serine/threonine protein kinase
MSCPYSKVTTERNKTGELGSGTYGKVYLVKIKNEKKALKTIDYTKFGVENLEEIDILFRLRHPNLLKSDDIVIYDECPNLIPKNGIGLVLPLASGDIKKLISTPAFDFNAISNIMYQQLSALKFLHENHYLHLDIKPQNILYVGKPENIKTILSDFGLSRYCDDVKKGIDPKGQLYISNPYRPPENLKDPKETYNEKSDVWSMGIFFNEMLSKSFPTYVDNFEELSIYNKDIELFKTNSEKTFKKATTLVPDIYKKYIDELLQGMLEIDRDKRFDVDQCFKVLENVNDEFKVPIRGTEVIVPRKNYNYSDVQLNFINKLTNSISKEIPLSCYFLILDLIMRSFVYSINTEEDLRERIKASILIGYNMYRFRTGLEENEQTTKAIIYFIKDMKGIIYRPYMFDGAKNLDQLEIMRQYLKEIGPIYQSFDYETFFKKLEPTKEDIPSKWIKSDDTIYKYGFDF